MTACFGGFLRRLRATSPNGVSLGSSCPIARTGASAAPKAASASQSRVREKRNIRQQHSIAHFSPGAAHAHLQRVTTLILWRKQTDGTAQENLGNGTEGRSEQDQRARVNEMEAQRVRAPWVSSAYKRPCDRNLVTGSTTTGIACRLKNQRATAKPIAA